ncbi:peptidoglycan-recognition protein LB-like [Zootermopsis nevadensis]|uniref:Peptidoglycan-recognition protein n=1 Tax=Zootermopsis nevadensis TaxID=136037 RepID=A0A067QGE8_ZOONE|nr:peptidoglycan-recognition protein LB-like [Zootermopsis nevadensis]KDR07311.1 Peptidoglycan-recognition protein LB [Zootermopsis nevadensis]
MLRRIIKNTLCVLFITHLAMTACPEIVPRADWGAVAAVSIVVLTSLPVPYVVIHHTFLPGFCNTSQTCEAAMRSMQNYHQNTNQWHDIGYHFCIGGTGKVYEGRGWDVVGTHTPKYNSNSTGICFIGDFRTELPTPEMLSAAKSLIECGVERGSISPEYKLLGHSQTRNTECPGAALFNEIKTWPHWDPLNNTSST